MIAILGSLWLASVGAKAASLEPPPGAASCSGCHAPSSRVATVVPVLVGRRATDIITQMQAFKAGTLPSTVMGRIARGFEDAEIAAIAAWYEVQR